MGRRLPEGYDEWRPETPRTRAHVVLLLILCGLVALVIFALMGPRSYGQAPATSPVPVVVAPAPPPGGMASWGPAEWTAFMGGVTVLLTALTASIVAVVTAVRGSAKSDSNEKAIDRLGTDVNNRMTNATAVANQASASAGTALLHSKPNGTDASVPTVKPGDPPVTGA
jgi:hypothetical protein